MSEYDELWEFLHKCDFQWECVADDSIQDNMRLVRIVFDGKVPYTLCVCCTKVQDGDEDE